MKNSKVKFSYFVREGLLSIFKHGFMSFASVFTILALLVIMGTFSLLAVNVSRIIEKVENDNLMLAYVNENLSESEARALEAPIRASSPSVTYVKFISRDQALIDFLGPDYEDDPRYQGIVPSDFRHRFEVYVSDVAYMESAQLAVRDVPGVDKVTANLTIARGLVKLRGIVSGVSVALVCVLIVVSLFLMSNTIKLATVERREEIAIMRMVGATKAFIRWPFVFEGFVLGMVGALAAYVVEWSIYNAAIKILMPSGATLQLITLVPFSGVALPLLALYVAIGFSVGVLGSLWAIRRYIKV